MAEDEAGGAREGPTQASGKHAETDAETQDAKRATGAPPIADGSVPEQVDDEEALLKLAVARELRHAHHVERLIRAVGPHYARAHLCGPR